MNNSRFAISLHILTLLAKNKGELLSSTFIAKSINMNPSVIRREISNLNNCSLVSTKTGKYGGSTLARPAENIRLSEVYIAISETPLLGYQRENPNPKCRVGRQINKHLNQLSKDVEEVFLEKLQTTSLADFSKQFK